MKSLKQFQYNFTLHVFITQILSEYWINLNTYQLHYLYKYVKLVGFKSTLIIKFNLFIITIFFIMLHSTFDSCSLIKMSF